MGGGKALILHALSMRSRHLDLTGGIMKTLDEFIRKDLIFIEIKVTQLRME